MTDGITCIEILRCEDYETLIACEDERNYGICLWNSTIEKCKFKDCTDF